MSLKNFLHFLKKHLRFRKEITFNTNFNNLEISIKPNDPFQKDLRSYIYTNGNEFDLDVSLYKNGSQVYPIDIFSIKNTSNLETYEDVDFQFYFINIGVSKDYRKNGLARTLLAQVILTLISDKPKNSFEFALKNTVTINGINKYDVYKSVLPNIDLKSDTQYATFTVQNRNNDIQRLKDLLKAKPLML